MKALLHFMALVLLLTVVSCHNPGAESKENETATHRHIKYYSGLYSFDLIDDTLYYVREKVCHNQTIQTIPVTSADLRIIDSLASSIDYAYIYGTSETDLYEDALVIDGETVYYSCEQLLFRPDKGVFPTDLKKIHTTLELIDKLICLGDSNFYKRWEWYPYAPQSSLDDK